MTWKKWHKGNATQRTQHSSTCTIEQTCFTLLKGLRICKSQHTESRKIIQLFNTCALPIQMGRWVQHLFRGFHSYSGTLHSASTDAPLRKCSIRGDLNVRRYTLFQSTLECFKLFLHLVNFGEFTWLLLLVL